MAAPPLQQCLKGETRRGRRRGRDPSSGTKGKIKQNNAFPCIKLVALINARKYDCYKNITFQYFLLFYLALRKVA